MIKRRIEWIDNLKAFTCFLVIYGHLIQSLIKSGIDPIIKIDEFINYFIYLFHMPLFMCISGILYFKNNNEFTFKQYKDFITKKIINLGIPYLTFYIIYMLMNTIFSNSVNNAKGIDGWIGIINDPIPPYWFLYTLISIFIVIPIIESILKNKYISMTLFLFLKLISIVFSTKIYFIDSIMKWGIYFYFGRFIKLNNSSNKRLIYNNICLILYILFSVVLYFLKLKINVYVYNILAIFFAIFGIIIMVSIFKKLNNSIILDTYKKYTMQIFLTHTIFAAACRIILLKCNIKIYILHLFVGIIASIYIPVIMSKISEKIKWTEFFFYPTKTIMKIKKGN